MQRGIIGVPTQDTDRLTTVEPYHRTKEEYGIDLTVAVAPAEQRTLHGGVGFVEGSALLEDVETTDTWVYDEDDNEISSRPTHSKTQHHSTFIAVPAANGDNGFAMVSSSDGEFVFGVLGHADMTPLDRATINLGDFYLAHEDDFTIQTGGQQGRLDQADTVMAWGRELEEDQDLGSAIHDAARVNNLPQLAGTYTSDAIDFPMNVNLAASGYVEVWDPELSTYEFLEWVRSDIMPYVDSPDASDDQDKSEKAEADPQQPGLDGFEDNAETCTECGRETDLNDEGLCVVCADAKDDPMAGGEV